MPAKIRELAAVSDLLTVEIEHVDAAFLLELVNEGYAVHPHPRVIQTIQDKFAQKEFLQANGIPLPDFRDTPTLEDAIEGKA